MYNVIAIGLFKSLTYNMRMINVHVIKIIQLLYVIYYSYQGNFVAQL